MATSIITVPNETSSSSSRTSKEGKKITYQMQVIQQPERARACGSGAKSSADRRPVDPPPIVELRIFEGENRQNDITFSYNANFFLFATLENARNIAHGRVQPSPASFPVLTGTPVAGMAYLDRPSPAGYFIFPDLSVRHEGKYRLSFALYEELKEPKDMDGDDHGEHARRGRADAHVSHRLEVKSVPFSVYSAKKFPGLTESTALSRMVAEQGCRVRIRRDVRMRRRDKAKDNDWDEYETKTAYDRNRSATPDVYTQNTASASQPVADSTERPRSQSNAIASNCNTNGSGSIGSSNVNNNSGNSTSSNAAPFPATPRRPSTTQDTASPYQHAYQSHMPPRPTAPSTYHAHVQYPPAPAPQYQSQYPPAPPQPATHLPQAPYTQSQSQPAWQPPAQSHAHVPQPYSYNSNPPPYSHYEHSSPPVRQTNVDHSHSGSDYRRSSVTAPPQLPINPLAPSPFGSLDSAGYNRHQPHMPGPQPPPPHANGYQAATVTQHSMHAYNLAPLKTLQPPADRLEPISPSYSTHGPAIASHDALRPRSFLTSATSTKRSFSATFDTNHIEQPLRGGARPNVPAFDSAPAPAPEEESPNEHSMSYRRADGRQCSRRVP